MNRDCDLSNPLIRDGVSQAQRLLPALDPDNPHFFKIDERTTEDLLCWLHRYAKQLQYYNGGNRPAGDWQVFIENDAELTEINPLIVTPDGKFIAADARLNVDDNSLFRHQVLLERVGAGISEKTKLEQRAHKLGMTYVELEGNIGIIGNGAGLVMATMDAVKYYGGAPANFLDVGGGATADRMCNALEIVLSHPDVEAVFINILGGITRCDEMARGIIDAQKTLSRDAPIVIRMIGTREKEGAEILAAANIPFLNSMDAAAKRVVEQVTKRG